MATTRVIAFYSSVPQSGKSTACSALIGDIDCVYRVKFAAPLKNMLRSLFQGIGMDLFEVESRIEGALKEDPIPALGGKSARDLAKSLGTSWGRGEVDPNVWANVTREYLLKQPAHRIIVIDDMRFPNEYQMLKDTFGDSVVFYHVHRSNHHYLEKKTKETCEGLLDNFPMVNLFNDGTLENWEKRVVKTVTDILS